MRLLAPCALALALLALHATAVRHRDTPGTLVPVAQDPTAEAHTPDEDVDLRPDTEDGSKQVLRKNFEVRSGHVALRFNYTCAPQGRINFIDTYTLTFWIRPYGTRGGYANILHHGAAEAERSPAVFFAPDSTQLVFRSGTKTDFDNGLVLKESLVQHRWTHVAVSHGPAFMKVWINGRERASSTPDAPVARLAPLYCGSGWADSIAFADIADLRFLDRVASALELNALVAARRFPRSLIRGPTFQPAKGDLCGRSLDLHTDQTNPAYSYAFWVKPQSVSAEPSSLLHKGASLADASPSFLLVPNSLQIEYRSVLATVPAFGVSPDKLLALNTWNHVGFSHGDGFVSVFLNGTRVVQNPAEKPVGREGDLYCSAPWLAPANVTLGEIHHWNKVASESVFAQLATKNPDQL